VFQTSIVNEVGGHARRHPDRPALEVVGGPALTYAQVWDRVHALAAVLADVPERDGLRLVTFLLPNGVDAALVYLACQLAGCVGIPLNSRLAHAELRFVLEDSGAEVLLTGAPFLDRAAALARDCGLRTIDCDAVPTVSGVPAERVAVDGSTPMVVGYTSGTTGLPKGGLYRGDLLLFSYLQWARSYRLDGTSTVLTPGPMFHLSYAGLTLTALLLGARVRMMTEFDAPRACWELDREATFAFLVPTMAAAVIAQARAEGRRALDAVRFVLSSGAPVSAELLADMLTVFPRATIAEAYGWSEAGWITFETKAPETLLPQCVGSPVAGSDLEVLREDGTPCAVGEAGEIAVRPALPFAGYLNHPEKTAEAVRDGFVLSGDIGIWTDDHRLLVVDRKKDMIVTGGENVYSAEVEQVLARHPAVVEVAVIGRPDPRWGEAVTAVVVVDEPGPTADELRAFCRGSLAGYKVPKTVELVASLPRTESGKVRRGDLE
jgi:acyl-CoA synthetase (AMP-forming)/AMP-acid ligase II